MDSVKVYPELNTVSLKSKQDLPLALWYELRRLDTNGSGRIPVPFVDRQSILKGSTLYRALKQGDGIYFEVYTIEGVKTLRIFGLKAVALNLGVTHISQPQTVSNSGFTNASNRRATLYASSLASNKERPISRIAQEGKYNRSKTTLIRYEKTTGIKSKPNYAVANIHNEGTPKLQEFKQLPNAYKSPYVPAHKGMTVRVNRALRSLYGVMRDEKPVQRYFTSYKSYLKCKHKDTIAYIKRTGSTIKGRSEYELVYNF